MAKPDDGGMATRPSEQRERGDRVPEESKGSRRDRQIVRILGLLRILVQNRRISIAELARHFGTRRETIYRDLRALQDAGYPVVGDENGRLSKPKLLVAEVPSVPFTKRELDLLIVLTTQAASPGHNSEGLASALWKLRALQEPVEIGSGANLEGVFHTWICGSKSFAAQEHKISALVEAILRKSRCLVSYRRPAATTAKQYEFDPYRLLVVGGGLYVIGCVPTHEGTATLAVDRLQSVALTSSTFEMRSDFSLEKRRDDAFGVSWENPMDVVLRFRTSQAPYVRERLWHPTQKIAELPDGGIEFTFRAGGPYEIRRWILGWADDVEVVSPESLRNEVAGVLRSALRTYSAGYRESCLKAGEA